MSNGFQVNDHQGTLGPKDSWGKMCVCVCVCTNAAWTYELIGLSLCCRQNKKIWCMCVCVGGVG